MLDCYMAWDVEYALRMAELVRPCRVRWIEECLPPDDYDGYAELTRRVEGMAIATGEHEYTRWGFRELLERRCCYVVQPDLTWSGGIYRLHSVGPRLYPRRRASRDRVGHRCDRARRRPHRLQGAVGRAGGAHRGYHRLDAKIG